MDTRRVEMDVEEFKKFGHAAIDYVANYTENLRERSVLPDVKPGYLYDKIPTEAPEKGEKWTDLLNDFDKLIMPGVTHWQSPQFHAFFPTGSSYPSIVGEILCAAVGVIGLHWSASPACTELEVVVMNWLGKLLGLPEEFLNSSPGPGGGVIQCSASETTMLCLLAAKSKTIRRIKKMHPETDENDISNRLIAYTSDQANSSVEKSGILGNMKMRILKTDEHGNLLGETLENAFANDLANGLIPCYMIATLGSTGTCVFDQLDLLGPICKKNNVWLHVDAAYAGAALILPEYKHLLNGIEYVTSFNFNPHKWLLVSFDCSALWLRDSNDLANAFSVERIYLKSEQDNQDTMIPEYRNWQISLGRRFRAIKLWFTLRTFGKEGLQMHLRNHINLAKLFATLVEQDERFEIVTPVRLGLVCFRLKGDNANTAALHSLLTARRNIYVIVATVNEKLIIRFVVCSRLCTDQDVHYAWNEIRSQADVALGSSCVNGHSRNGQDHNGHIL